MKRKIFLLASIFIFFFSLTNAQEIIQKGNVFYLSNTLVVKVKANTSTLQKSLNKAAPKFSIQGATQLFPSSSKLNKGEEALSRIYLIKYSSPEDPIDIAPKISKLPGVEWAEPKYVHRITYSPNDSLYVLNQQKNLQRIFADSAWNIARGDTSIRIGIVDTGVDWDHPDLKANIATDKNGNRIGIDLGGLNGTPDNDPREDPSPTNRYHGTHVAGIADAVTDNRIGIASIGFNCRIIPVKVSRSDKRDSNGYPFIYYGFEGIKYAVDNNAKVINCSWGGYGYSRFEQDIIDYAITKGALVVAADGNEDLKTPFYPASYRGVLSVGWSESTSDLKSPFGNYGRTVKVFAPGTSILSTWQKDSQNSMYYNSISGSSMSSPLAAGLAALVFSVPQFKNYTPLQIAEQIRVTADNMEPVNEDSLKFLLGSGRINAYRAVHQTNTNSVRAVAVKFIDEGNKNGILESGEQVSVEINFMNFLSPVTNVSVNLESGDNAIIISNSSFETGSIATLDTVNNHSNRFQFTIQPNAPLNYDLNFLLKFNSAGYSDFQWISTRINPTYDTHNVGNITMTVTSKGTLAFDDYPSNLEGDGFKFAGGDNLMFEGALMYGRSADKIMNEARISDKQSADFVTIVPMKVKDVGNDQNGYTVFSDAGAGANALGIETRLSTYSYALAPNDKFIILNPTFYNTTSQDINGFYAGYYIDWDLPADNPTQDSTYFDQADNFAVALDETGTANAVVGTALISSDKYGYYPIDNNASTGEIILFDANGFSDQEKWITLSSGVKNRAVGSTDISIVVSGGPFNIPANQSINVAFAIAAGATKDELKSAIRQSRVKFRDIGEWQPSVTPTDFTLYQNYPNPFNPGTVINYYLPQNSLVTIKLYDILGREIATLINDVENAGLHKFNFAPDKMKLTSGVYFYRLQAGSFSETKKMILLK